MQGRAGQTHCIVQSEGVSWLVPSGLWTGEKLARAPETRLSHPKPTQYLKRLKRGQNLNEGLSLGPPEDPAVS